MRAARVHVLFAAVGLSMALPGAVRADYPDEVLADSPIAYWRLGETTGVTAENLGSIGPPVDGTYTGGLALGEDSLLPIEDDPCVAFDGIDGEIAVPDDGQINTGGPYPSRTIELWFLAEQIGPTPGVLFEEGGATRGLNIYVWEIEGEDLLFVHGWNRNASEGYWDRIFASTPVSEGETYHVVMVFDASENEIDGDFDGRITGYLNGTSFGTATGADLLYGHSNDNGIGGIDQNTRFHDNSTMGDGANFGGLIDEVALYDFPLDDPDDDGDRSDSRVLDHYAAAFDKACPIALAATREGATVRLTWRAGEATAQSVRVTRDGTELAAAAPVDPPAYVDAGPEPGFLTYELTFDVPGEACDPLTTHYNGCIAQLRATRTDEGVELTWTNRLPYAQIEVRRDAELLATIGGSEASYTDPDPPSGPWTYSVAPTNGTCEPATVDIEVYPSDDVSPWTSEDIGQTLAGGIERIDEDAFDIFADGNDIWNTADAFRFTYQEFEGDFVATARIDNIDLTNAWAKAGMMARASTAPESAYVFMHATPTPGGNGVDLQWRDTDGINADHQGETGDGSFFFPVWVRLARIGSSFTGSYSIDGIDWTDLGTHAVQMDDPILVGMALTSHNAGAITTAEFREVSLEELDVCPTDLACICLGATEGVSLGWTNHYEYLRIRIYRSDAEGTTRRVGSIEGEEEEHTDTIGLDALPPGTLTYEVIPVVGVSEVPSCTLTCEVPWPCEGGPVFIRSDVDGDGRFTLGDGVQVLMRQFADLEEYGSNCDDTADVDDNGMLTIGDAILIFNFLFGGGADPKAPFPGCGPDPTPGDPFDCKGYPAGVCP